MLAPNQMRASGMTTTCLLGCPHHSNGALRKIAIAFVGLCLSVVAGCDASENRAVKLSKLDVVLPEPGPRVKAISALVRDRCAMNRSIAEELERSTERSRIASIRIAKSIDPTLTGMTPASVASREGLDWQRGTQKKTFSCEQLSCAAKAGDPVASYFYARDIQGGKCPGNIEDVISVLEKSLADAEPINDSPTLSLCWDHLGSSTRPPDEFYLCKYGLPESWQLLGISLQALPSEPSRRDRIEYAFQAAWKLGGKTRPSAKASRN